eukprot:119973-Amorphochlora_amoeboformis.AAC.2
MLAPSSLVTLDSLRLQLNYLTPSLFRLLLVVSADQAEPKPSDDPSHIQGRQDAEKLNHGLLEILIQHLSVLNKFRAHTIQLEEEEIEFLEGEKKEGEEEEQKEEKADPTIVQFWQPDHQDPENVNKKETSMSFSHQSDFDENGIIHFLGSLYGKYYNPSVKAKNRPPPLIKLSASSIKSDPRSLSLLTGREPGRLLTKNEQNAWFQIYFGKNKRIVPTAYTLRHYESFHQECLRNWKLEASNDGQEWVTLKEHVNDTKIVGKNCTATWPIKVLAHQQHGWSYFRIFMTGPNSSGRNYLCCAGIEFYGILQGKFLDEDHSDGADGMGGDYWNRLATSGITFNSSPDTCLDGNSSQPLQATRPADSKEYGAWEWVGALGSGLGLGCLKIGLV